jgi:hypothetical protein
VGQIVVTGHRIGLHSRHVGEGVRTQTLGRRCAAGNFEALVLLGLDRAGTLRELPEGVEMVRAHGGDQPEQHRRTGVDLVRVLEAGHCVLQATIPKRSRGRAQIRG